MRVIWKYQVLNWVAELALPVGATFIHFAFHDGLPTLWFIIPDKNDTEHVAPRRFRIFGTGHEISGDEWNWLATTTDDAPLVWHLFEAL